MMNVKLLWDKIKSNILSDSSMRVILIVTGVCLIGYTCYHVNSSTDQSTYQTEINTWKSRANKVLSDNNSLRTSVDSLNLLVHKNNLKADSLHTKIAALENSTLKNRQNNDIILTGLENSLPDTCKHALDLAKSYRSESDTLRLALNDATQLDSIRGVQIFQLETNVNNLTVQNDSLKHVIVDVPVYKPQKFLGLFRLPSRKTSFVVGVALGVAGTVGVIAGTH